MIQGTGPAVDVPTILQLRAVTHAEREALAEWVHQLRAEARERDTRMRWTQAVLVQSGEEAW